MRWTWIVLLLVSGVSDRAAAQFVNGNQLYDWGREDERLPDSRNIKPYSGGVFTGYVTGVADAIDAALCIPEGVTIGQLGEVVMKYLREHPEDRHDAAAFLVFKALDEPWPCPKKDEKEKP